MPFSNAGFQTFTNRELPKGVLGDWAGANIRASVPVGPWALKAPPSGTLVGGIGWADPAAGICSNYYRPNSFAGFVHRAGQGSITAFLGIASLQIPAGGMVTDLVQGDFWGLFQSGCSVGQKVYANPTTGALTANTSGQGVTASNTGASITSNVLTTTDADATGTVAVGQVVYGTGVPAGTYIASADGTGSGTHLWNLANLDGTAIPNITSQTMNFQGAAETQWTCAENVPADTAFTATIAAETGQAPFGVLTVSAISSGTLSPGQWIASASGAAVSVPITANVQIIEQLTGSTGSTGTYLISNTILVGSGQGFTATQGKMAKISTWASQL